MEISNAIIHEIKKEKETSGDNAATIRYRKKELKIDENIATLCNDTLNLYTKIGNSYGTLDKESETANFPNILQKYIDNTIDFESFSKSCVNIIHDSMKDQRMATTSWPLLVSYKMQNKNWLLIAMIKMRKGVGLDEETLDLNGILSFDISDLHEAAKIDLDKYKENEGLYLSFVKKVSKGDVTQYFRKALSCIDYTDSKFHTEKLISAFSDYRRHEGWDSEKYKENKQKIYDYLMEKNDKAEPAYLTAISSILDDSDPLKFFNFVKENELPLNDAFSPHKNTFKKLKNYRGTFGTITVGFAADDAISSKISYDEDEDVLIIKRPSKKIINDIKEAKGDFDDDSYEGDESR